MLPIVALLGCGGADADREGGLLPPGETGPALELTEPARGSYLPAGPATVRGVAREMTGLTFQGQPLTPSGGAFAAEVTLDVGLNTFEVRAVDPEGRARADLASVLAGDFVAADGLVRDAVQVHVSAAGLAAAGPLVGDLLDPATLDPSVQALNPVIDTAEALVTLGTLSFGTPEVGLVPTPGALLLTVHLPDFVLPIEATVYDALPFGIDLDLDVDVAADGVTLLAPVELSTDGQGGLVVGVGAIDAELAEFDLDTGLLELVDWLFVDDDDLAQVLEAELAGLGPTLEDLLTERLAALDLSVETELLGDTLVVEPSFDHVRIDPSGVALSLGIAIDVAGAPGGQVLSLGAPPAGQGGEVHVQVADDLLERLLFELWAAGALDLELPLVDEAAMLLPLFGGKDQGTLRLAAGLPPVWVERDGAARLQLGEVLLTVETPGGDYGERVELALALDAKAELAITPEAVGIVLSDANVAMRLVGDSEGDPLLEEKLPGIEGAFGLGVGLMNSLLSFPLEGLPLPELTVARDPSGRGSVLELGVADLATLLP